MPLSNDNQDYQNKENKEKNQQGANAGGKEKSTEDENNFTSDNLKGKQQVDADLDNETDKAADVGK